MGDCGAFNYWREETPPYTPDQVIDFYDECGFDLGISVDHVILGYDPSRRQRLRAPQAGRTGRHGRASPWTWPHEFLARCQGQERQLPAARRRPGLEPGLLRRGGAGIAEDRVHEDRCRRHGAAQDSRDPRLPEGHRMRCAPPAPNCTCLESPAAATSHEFATFGVTSFDSTSAFRQAFKDDKDNYHMLDRTYTAVRVPQVDGNPKLKSSSGLAGSRRKRLCCGSGNACGRCTDMTMVSGRPREAVDALMRYEELFSGRQELYGRLQ